MKKNLQAFAFAGLLLLLACRNQNEEKNVEQESTNSEQQSQTTTACSGNLGDVKYSVLPLKSFQKENGDCWLLMDSIPKAFAQKFTLYKRYKIDSIPDARGVFLRGMNSGRNKLTGDPSGDRPIGSFQNDENKPHTHDLLMSPGKGEYGTNWNLMPPLQGDDRVYDARPPMKSTYPVVASGVDESRPRNISLYIYIKVN